MHPIYLDKKLVKVLRGEETIDRPSSTGYLTNAVLRCYELMSYGLIQDAHEYNQLENSDSD